MFLRSLLESQNAIGLPLAAGVLVPLSRDTKGRVCRYTRHYPGDDIEPHNNPDSECDDLFRVHVFNPFFVERLPPRIAPYAGGLLLVPISLDRCKHGTTRRRLDPLGSWLYGSPFGEGTPENGQPDKGPENDYS